MEDAEIIMPSGKSVSDSCADDNQMLLNDGLRGNSVGGKVSIDGVSDDLLKKMNENMNKNGVFEYNRCRCGIFYRIDTIHICDAMTESEKDSIMSKFNYKRDNAMDSNESYNRREQITIADILSNTDCLEGISYKFSAEIGLKRRLSVTFDLFMTELDYKKISDMMSENVRTGFKEKEDEEEKEKD